LSIQINDDEFDEQNFHHEQIHNHIMNHIKPNQYHYFQYYKKEKGRLAELEIFVLVTHKHILIYEEYHLTIIDQYVFHLEYID
jgi:DNA mismatch repair ATPase MutL